MHRNKSVDVHQFAMVPNKKIPRSRFTIEHGHKTTLDGGKLYPLFLQEILPGDSISLSATMFARMATPIYPLMDNLHLTSFFFFIPNRLVWSNWKKFMGEQATPASSISFTIPQKVSPASGYTVGSLHDYFGLPTVGQVTGGLTTTNSALPMRGYALTWNEWFRDENIQDSVTVDLGDGPDTTTSDVLLSRGKRHDYFTGGLPWPQKGNTASTLPLGTSAPVLYSHANTTAWVAKRGDTGATFVGAPENPSINAAGQLTNAAGTLGLQFDPSGNLYADLSTATAATINQLRQAISIQEFLENNARGGTRYTEILRARFGVTSPDARLQRPEYLGGGSTNITVNPIAQTSGTSASGTTTPMGTLAAMATGLASNHGFSQSFVEHGYVLGLIHIGADLTYQQGIARHWSRSTSYDFYAPEFAHLGEQSILSKEIYATGAAADDDVFAYQERWAEYRYKPSMITGLFRSTAAGTLDPWHAAQKFTARPTLNTTFITDTPPIDRLLAVSSTGKQFLFDSFFRMQAARPMPMYSVPGFGSKF